MEELIKSGCRVSSSLTEEESQTLAVLEVEGINQSFSAYGSTKSAAKNAAASLAQKHISNNDIIVSQLYSDELSKIQVPKDEETPNQILKRLYPDVEAHFETLCILQVGEQEFEGRGESRGMAKLRASASALETLNGMNFDMDKYVGIVKKETRESKDVEKHPASALHEVVGHKAIFTFEEENQPNSEWKTFKCNVSIDDKLFSGSAANKRLAKYNAAMTALNGLGLSKKFKLMAPPVENVPLFNPGLKRRTELPFSGRWPSPKRGRGEEVGRGSNFNSRFSGQRPSLNDNKFEPTVYRERGRGRDHGRMNFDTRRGPRVRGRGQGAGEFSTAPYSPQEDSYGVQEEPGYGPPREPYLGYSEYSGMEGYDQGYNPDYSPGFKASTSPSTPTHQARGRYFQQQRGGQGFGAYPNTDIMYHHYNY